MPCYALEHCGHIAHRGALLFAGAISEVAQPENVVVERQTVRQGGEAFGIAAIVYEGRGKGAQMIVPGLKSAVAQGMGGAILGKILPGAPGEPVINILFKRWGKG